MMRMKGLLIVSLLVGISTVVSAHPQPVVDITGADITQDRIHVDLSPSGLTGTLKLELVTPDYHLIREVSRSSGSYNYLYRLLRQPFFYLRPLQPEGYKW